MPNLKKIFEDRYTKTRSAKLVRNVDESLLRQAVSLIEEGRHQEAIAILNSADNMEHDPGALRTRGVALFHAGDIEAARRDQEHALELYNELTSTTLANLALIAFHQAKYEEGVCFARQARAVWLSNPLAWVNELEGLCYLADGDFSAVWAVIEDMARLWPEGLGNEIVRAHLRDDGSLAVWRATDPGYHDRITSFFGQL